MLRRPPCSPLFPYTTLFRSRQPLRKLDGLWGQRPIEVFGKQFEAVVRRQLQLQIAFQKLQWASGPIGRRAFSTAGEIGRASCRERVESTVGAGALQTERRVTESK